MTARIAQWAIVLVVMLLPQSVFGQECPPGAPMPETFGRGFEPGAHVQIDIQSVAGDGNCMIAGIQRWSGVNGVQLATNHASPTAYITVKCCMTPGMPGYAADVVAYAHRQGALRGANSRISHITIFTGPNWNGFMADHNWDCEVISKVMAHEAGHTFGVGHHPPGSNHLMQRSPGSGGMAAMSGFPSACEKKIAELAKDARVGGSGCTECDGVGKPSWGCEDGGPGVSDSKQCCNAWSKFTYSGNNHKAVGHVTTLNATVVPTGGSGELTIHAQDIDGYITRVGWYVNGVLTHTSFAEPWSAPYSNAPAGTHTVKAAVYDSADEYSWSQEISMTVGNYFATDTLSSGQHLFPGYVLVAPNWGYYLRLNSDGTLVLYNASHAPIASTGTFGSPLFAYMETDGNFTLRHSPYNVVFQTGTAAQANSHAGVRVLSSGQLAVVRLNGQIAWTYP